MAASTTFTDKQLIKIDSGVATFLARIESSSIPFSSLTWFIDELKGSPDWTRDEIIELQTRALRLILYRQRLLAKKPDSTRERPTVDEVKQ